MRRLVRTTAGGQVSFGRLGYDSLVWEKLSARQHSMFFGYVLREALDGELASVCLTCF